MASPNRREFNGLLATALSGITIPHLAWATTSNERTELLTVINPEPASLNLAINQQLPTSVIGAKIFDGLLTYDFDLKPMPALARSWTVSEDGLVYRFDLQPTASWHDGTPFTALDVVFSTTELLPETHPQARLTFGRCKSITAIDDHTVEFRLHSPFAPFLASFDVAMCPILPRHIYRGTDYRANSANNAPIGSGPFKFEKWVPGSYIKLVRNDGYYVEGLPKVDVLLYRIVPDASLRAIGLEDHSIQLAGFNDVEPFDVERLRANPDLQVTTKGYELFGPLAWLEVNNRKPPLDDKRFRKALMHAIDRQTLIDRVWFGLGKIATSPVSSVTRFHDPNLPLYDYSPQKAAALVKEIGIGNGQSGPLKLLVPPFGEIWQRSAEFVRQQLGEVGIVVELENVDVATFGQRLANWDYDLSFNYTFQFGDPALGVERTYLTSAITKGVLFSNTEGYSNKAVDDLFTKASSAVGDDERQRLYSQVQQILVEDVPLVWLFEMAFPTIADVRIKDAVTTGAGIRDNLAKLWIDHA